MKTRWAVVLAVSTLILAVAWPAGAGRIALALVTVVAGAMAIPALVDLARRFPPLPAADRFRDPGHARAAPERPTQLMLLERAVESSATPTAILSYPVREQLRASARRRLVDHQRLDPNNALHRPAVVARVSPELWAILEPPSRTAGGPRTRPVATAALPSLIAEIERL